MRPDCFLHWLTQLRLWHWETTSYAEHIATGNAYDAFNERIDHYIEVYQGSYPRVPLPTWEHCPDYVSIQDRQERQEAMRWFREYLAIDLVKPLDRDIDTDLINLRDEMLAELHKLAYLFSLE
jgi:hypothetical protein